MLISERIHNIISEENILPNKKLLMFWEQHYLNFTEDARTNEYQILKKEYFRIADEYESMITDKAYLNNDALYKRYMIMQRKTGIRMIAAARGTEYESEARTFEAQTAGTPAGNRSATIIRHNARTKDDAKYGRGFQASSMTFMGLLKDLINHPPYIRHVITMYMFKICMALLNYILQIQSQIKQAKTAEVSKHWSDLVSNAAGEKLVIKIKNSNRHDIFEYNNTVIVTSKIISNLDKKEVIALSLYAHGTTKYLLIRGLITATFATLLSTSLETVLTYLRIKEQLDEPGSIDPTVMFMVRRIIAEYIIVSLNKMLNTEMAIKRGLKFVRDRGYLKYLVLARKKFPKSSKEKIPDIDYKVATIVDGYFNSILNIIKFKKNVKKNNVSSSFSILKKAASIFKKFK